MKNLFLITSALCFVFLGCSQSKNSSNNTIEEKHSSMYLKTNEQWKKILSPEVFEVTRNKINESAGKGRYINYDSVGTYNCSNCNNSLFSSKLKIKGSKDFAAFQEGIDDHITLKDSSGDGCEVFCKRCDSYLGFKRFNQAELRINSLSLQFYISNDNMKEATFGAGCFWCIEACFKDLKGVETVTSGYSNGLTKNPSYKEVCTGNTGYAEVARVVYDESIISFDELLEAFWFVHDPTQLNRQGNDVGTQYRSAVFYHSVEQKQKAALYKQRLIEEKVWNEPIVTEISPIKDYYPAEDYHQNYLELNPENAYCRAIVRPKVDKFRKVFSEKLDK